MAKRKKMSLERKKAVFGVLFISPWLIGFTLLLVIPLFQSIHFSFSRLTIEESGYSLAHIGLENYRNAFKVDPQYLRFLTESVKDMALNVPLIIFFSLFTASLLSQKFRGRMFARAIIFLPVVLASGVIAKLDSSNFLAQMMGTAAQEQEGNFSGFQGVDLMPLLLEAGMSKDIVLYLVDAVERIYQIVSLSGVQILIFLAGMQSISSSLYEAAKIEGATGYEAFWKITFPMISPFILANTVYSIVDSFTNNNVTKYIHTKAFVTMDFGISSAMSWVYFLVISGILLISTYFISRKVFYYD